MKFKMAENSLFAILLRSTWWYSVLIGLVITAICIAITDAKYIALSITAGLPFLVIGGWACFKQSQQPSQKRVLEVTEQAKKMQALAVAQKIATSYTSNGYESNTYQGNGAELELKRAHQKLLVCTKRFKAANTGIDPLKSLVAVGEKVDATGYLYVTLGDVTDAALDYAQQNRIEIVQSSRLVSLFDGKAKVS